MIGKKILNILLACVVALTVSKTVSASEAFSMEKFYDEGYINFSYTNSECAYIEYGVSIFDKDNIDGEPIYATQVKSDMVGKITFNMLPIASGEYTLSVVPITGNAEYKVDFYFFSQSELDNLWAVLVENSNKSLIRDNWEEIKEAFEFKENEGYEKSDDTYFYMISVNEDIHSLGERNEAETEKLRKILGEIELLAAIDYIDENSEVEYANKLIKDANKIIAKYDAAFSNELQNILKSEISDEVITVFMSDTGSVYSVADLVSVLKDSIEKAKVADLLAQINSANHQSLIKNILTGEGNAALLGIESSIEDYKKLKDTSSVDEQIVSKTFSDTEEFAKVFSDAVALAEKEETVEEDKSVTVPPRGGSGGSVGMTSGVSHPASQENSKVAVFSDMEGYQWADEAVKRLFGKNIIHGYENNTFKPQKSISRAEFVKIIMEVLGKTDGGATSFSDVNENDWFKNYVSSAADLKIIYGNDGLFRPHENITREDAAVIILRALNLKGISLSGSAGFADSANISDYAKEAVGALAHANLLVGMPGNLFEPKMNMTRAEMAVFIDRTINNFISGEVE